MLFKTKLASGLVGILAITSGIQREAVAQTADNGFEEKWSVITIASNGAWGAAINRHKASARLAAIRECRARSTTVADDCGERTAVVLGGWALAYACGQRHFVVAEPTLAEAQLYARYRETELRFAQGGGLGLPSCRLVVKVDPDGKASIGAGM